MNVKSYLQLIFLVFITAMALSGCGGGGGGGGSDPTSTQATTYNVTATAGAGGTITPSNQTVVSGGTATFNVLPENNYSIASVTGCNGTLSGNTYTSGTISADCSVTASFIAQTYTVTASAGANGTITPASQTVSYGAKPSFTITPATGYAIKSVTATSGCYGGTLTGNTYTTGKVISNCTVSAMFSQPYKIGGNVSGLNGTGLVLLDNGGDSLVINANGSFAFPIPQVSYNVTIETQPTNPNQICKVTGGVGVAATDITSIQVTCINSYTVGGTVSGLKGGTLSLRNDSNSDFLTIGSTGAFDSNGPFTFTKPIAQGSTYNVAVNFQPSGQTCTVTNGSGTMPGSNVTDVAVLCSPWSKVVSSGGSRTTGVGTDTSGNVYLAGYAKGPTGASYAFYYFLQKYAPNGNRVYAITDYSVGFPGTFTQVYGMSADSDGNAYVVGWMKGTLDGVSSTGGGTHSNFLTKYNSSGTRLYTKVEATGASEAYDVATDADGNVYVVGVAMSGIDGNTLTGTSDLFLTKYSNTGTKLFTRQMGVAAKETLAKSVAVDSYGNVLVVGYTTGGLDGNSLTGTKDLFLTKFDNLGNKLFTKQLGVALKDTVANAVAIDVYNNVFIAGYTTGGLSGNTLTGTSDYFLSKYDSSGIKLYTRQMGVTGVATSANGLTTDAYGNIYITGDTAGGLDGNIQPFSEGYYFLFVAKYDNGGNKLYTSEPKINSRSSGNVITIDPSSNVYVGGYIADTWDSWAAIFKFDDAGTLQ